MINICGLCIVFIIIHHIVVDSKVLFYKNFNLTTIETPINVERLSNMLVDSGYNKDKTAFLIDGFTHGFHLGYEGPLQRTDFSANLPFRGVGSKLELWNKVMKEVECKRYAGPFVKMPYSNFIQSPIGLVPRQGTRRVSYFTSHMTSKGSNRTISTRHQRDVRSNIEI